MSPTVSLPAGEFLVWRTEREEEDFNYLTRFFHGDSGQEFASLLTDLLSVVKEVRASG